MSTAIKEIKTFVASDLILVLKWGQIALVKPKKHISTILYEALITKKTIDQSGEISL